MLQTQELVEDRTIFRAMDCDADECSSPVVARANPVSDIGDSSRVISPYPYSQSAVEIEESWKLTEGIDCFSMDEEDSIETIESLTPLEAGQHSASLYSFYFETSPMDQQCDDLSITSHETASFADEGYDLEDIPASFWELGVAPSSQERPLSPAQISISSDSAVGLSQSNSQAS